MYSTDSFVYSHDEQGSFIEYVANTRWDIPWQRYTKSIVCPHMEAGDLGPGSLLLIYF
jgi:hypothetical protein